MLIARHADAVVAWAPAKVNLYLEILRKRLDGYHDIATLMVAVTLYDTLEFRDDHSGGIRLECNEAGLSTGPENLVYRAALLLRRQAPARHGTTIRLRKRIPVAAGLGGGSSDAAATLAALNQLWQLGLSKVQLMDLGAQIGSDVAFFFSTPAAWCTGRGERVTPLSLATALWFVLLCPHMGLATADVYRNAAVSAQPEDGTSLLRAVDTGDVEEMGRQMHNRLQRAAQELCPALAGLRARIEGFGPAGQMLSGSGTTLFALCRNRSEAQRIAQGLRTGSRERMDPRVFIVRSCS